MITILILCVGFSVFMKGIYPIVHEWLTEGIVPITNQPPPANTDDDNSIQALEHWHMAYELGYTPAECDGIAQHTATLYDDTLRRYRLVTKDDAWLGVNDR